jgi:hypothetical protein
VAFALAAGLAATVPPAYAAGEEAGAALRSRYQTQAGKAAKLPVVVESRQTGSTLEGEVYARVEQQFSVVRSELARPSAWCEIMILHPNVNGCAVDAGEKSITVRLGRARTPATFGYRIVRTSEDYLDVRLSAPSGPFGTTDYTIRIEATPLDERTSVLHLAYSHGYGAQAKLALTAYFNTFGRGKVGFTQVGKKPDGTPVYVDELRGGIERNAMRYHLAIESYLLAASAPKGQRLDQAFESFRAGLQRFPLQLEEEDSFVQRKREEIERFRATVIAGSPGEACPIGAA